MSEIQPKYVSFEYTRSDGTIITQDIFFSEHAEVILSPSQMQNLEQLLEVQCIMILKEKGSTPPHFVERDSITGEYFLTPLENIKVFYKKMTTVVYIFDIQIR